MAEALGAVTIVTRASSVLPLDHSATGRLFAAHLPPSVIASLPAKERGSIARIDLASIREQGIASVRGTLVPGIDALAVPVLDPKNRVVASLTALGLATAFDAAPQGPIAAALRLAAADIAAKLGGESERSRSGR